MYICVYEIKNETVRRLIHIIDVDVWNFVKKVNERLPSGVQLRGEDYFVEAEATDTVIKYTAVWTYQCGQFSNYFKHPVEDRPNCLYFCLSCQISNVTYEVSSGLYTVSFHLNGNSPENSQVIREKDVSVAGISTFFDDFSIHLVVDAISNEYL